MPCYTQLVTDTVMMNEDWSLNTLIQQWGLERISRAIRPLFLGVDEDNQITAPDSSCPDCAARRRFEQPTFVINASVNDKDLWDALNAVQQNTLLMACCEFHLDMDSLANDLNDIIEPLGHEGCELADE
jgi:hypothetical protein